MTHQQQPNAARALATLGVAFLCVLLGLVAFDVRGETPEPEPEVPVVVEVVEVEQEPIFRRVSHTIERGESFGAILQRHGIGGVNDIVAAALPHANLARVRAGETLEIRFVKELPVAFRYALDEDRTLHVHLLPEPFAEVEEVQYEVDTDRVEVVVDGTLWDAAIGAGFRARDIVTFARIFEYDVDFATELRAGARLVAVADRLSLDDEFVKIGDIHAIRLENAGKSWTFVNFEDSWYKPDGRTRARPFLRTPLEFTRVTGDYGEKRTRGYHGGVDFGAPTGTPVRAAADGVVELAQWNGGYGKYVRVEHPKYGPYKTCYAHLSQINVKKGEKVKQGDIIGLVGSTGRSTGPHLHYEFKVDDKRVNPLTQVLPDSAALDSTRMAAFETHRDSVLGQLDEVVLADAD